MVTAPLSATEDRAPRPGPRGMTSLLAAGALVLLLTALGIGVFGLVQQHDHPLGTVPRYRNPLEKTLVGTVAHPALTIEGDYVKVETSSYSALALVEGPVVPGEGLPFQATYTTCTWTITLSHVRGRLPISTADFDSIDHTGAVYKPYLVPGQPALPAFLLPGHSLSFKLRSVMPVGEGLMRWAPGGNNIVAKWDYQVEND